VKAQTVEICHSGLATKFFHFSREGGPPPTEFCHFRPDGEVGGKGIEDAKSWLVTDGSLLLLDRKRACIARFDEAVSSDGLLTLEGHHTIDPAVVLRLQQQPGRPSHSRTRRALSKEITRYGWNIGNHTYGVPSFVEKGLAKLTIGKYCSIAEGVKISFGNHRTDLMSTYPFATLDRYWPQVPLDVPDHVSKGDVVIGSDVWIGSDVFISSGVTIGSGAVIGAGSFVAKDIPPYAVAVGRPAAIIRHRFEPEVIADLLELKWWDLHDHEVDDLLPFIMSTDHQTFIARLRLVRQSREGSAALSRSF
jgi:acetyltransferase-like isoleucine patch superfamily enzyme